MNDLLRELRDVLGRHNAEIWREEDTGAKRISFGEIKSDSSDIITKIVGKKGARLVIRMYKPGGAFESVQFPECYLDYAVLDSRIDEKRGV